MGAMLRTLVVLSVAASAVGCVADSSDSLGSQSDDISASSRTYVALRRDTRKCASPMCGGYWVHDVNRLALNEKYVSRLDFTGSGLDQATIDVALAADPGELLLHGKLGSTDAVSHTQTFLVSEAWRGLPGLVPATGAFFYATADKDPEIQCFTTPCNEESATKLNSTSTTSFTSLDLTGLAVGGLDRVWVAGRALRNGGLVAGTLQQGPHDQGGYETLLAASQVYVRLPNAEYACAIGPEHDCGDQEATYTRDENLCLHFDQCVDRHPCPLYVLACPDGYTRDSWIAAPKGCSTSVCTPSFIDE
jgi:hypothetical protein